MKIKYNIFNRIILIASITLSMTGIARAANDDGIVVDQSKYANREVLPDFTGGECPNNPRALTQISGNLVIPQVRA
jgi:hypothetical protein